MHKSIDSPLCFEDHVGVKGSAWLMDCPFINTRAYATAEAGGHEKVECKNVPSTQNLKDFFNTLPKAKTKDTHCRANPVKKKIPNNPQPVDVSFFHSSKHWQQYLLTGLRIYYF